MRSAAAGGFEFETWFAEYVMSPDASRRIWSYCQKYGLRHHDLDDVRLTWYERVINTARRSGLPATVIDPDQATPYVLVAARRVAHDLACRGPASREAPSDDQFEIRPPIYDAELTQSDQGLPAEAWCDRIRGRISRRLYGGRVECSGCRGAEVAQLSLEVVNVVCESEAEEEAFAPWIAALKGGTTGFAKLMYQAIETVHPERLDVDDEGRVSARSRAYKKRCEPCVVQLLTDVIAEQGRHTGESENDQSLYGTKADPT